MVTPVWPRWRGSSPLARAVLASVLATCAVPVLAQSDGRPPDVTAAGETDPASTETRPVERGRPLAEPRGGAQPLASPVGLAADERRNGWVVQLGAEETYDTNPGFSTDPARQEDSFNDDVRGLFGYNHQRVRAGALLWVEGAYQRYRELQDEQFVFGVGAEVDFRPTERTTLVGSATAGRRYARNIQVLADTGILLPLTPVDAGSYAGRIQIRTSQRTTFETGVRYDTMDFADQALVDGDQLIADVEVERRMGTNHTLSAAYRYRRSLWQTGSTDTHGGLAGWRGDFNPWLSGSFFAGVAYLTDAVNRSVEPLADVQLVASSSRSQVGVRYGRTTDQAFGLGRDRVADIVSLDASRTVTRTVTASAGGTWSWSSDPLDETFNFSTVRYEADLRWVFARGFALEGGYLYSRNTGGLAGADTVDSHQISLGVRYDRQ
jgi:hypothetical protein